MLLGARQFFQTRKKLPYDAEVEYLESTGTQWIDTGVVATSNTHINVRFSDYSVSGAWLFGARIAYQNSALGVYTDAGVANNSFRRARGSFVSGSFTYTTVGVGVVTFDYDKETFTATRESDTYTVTYTNTASAFSSSPYTIHLWTLNNGGGSTNIASAKIYSVKIWENDILVRDFVPVRVGGVGYMYDRVSKKLFGNAGTGDFVVGPDIVEVEYLESTGTSYIDTGVIVSTMDYSITMDVMPTASTQAVLIGTMNTNIGYPGVMLNDIGTFRYGTQQAQSISLPLVANTKYSCVLSYKQLVVDGMSFSTTGTTLDTPPTHSLYLFARNNVGTVGNQSKCKIYKLTISDGTNILMDMIPVRVGMEGAMMDKLTRRIYRNAGTGAFLYGPDKS